MRPVTGVLLASTLALPGAGCRERPARPTAEEAVLAHQVDRLRVLTAEAEGGPLVTLDRMLVAVDQSLVQQLLSAAVPYERVVGGRYRVTVTAASVAFEDGAAIVRLHGTAAYASARQPASAEVSLHGSLEVVELDPATATLRGRVRLLAFEARRVDVLGLEAPVRELVEDLARERLESFAALASTVEIPVRLESRLVVPAAPPGSPLKTRELSVPVQATVASVRALRGRLWIALTAGLGT